MVCIAHSSGVHFGHGVSTLHSSAPALVELAIAPHVRSLVERPLLSHVNLVVTGYSEVCLLNQSLPLWLSATVERTKFVVLNSCSPSIHLQELNSQLHVFGGIRCAL